MSTTGQILRGAADSNDKKYLFENTPVKPNDTKSKDALASENPYQSKNNGYSKK